MRIWSLSGRNRALLLYQHASPCLHLHSTSRMDPLLVLRCAILDGLIPVVSRRNLCGVPAKALQVKQSHGTTRYGRDEDEGTIVHEHVWPERFRSCPRSSAFGSKVPYLLPGTNNDLLFFIFMRGGQAFLDLAYVLYIRSFALDLRRGTAGMNSRSDADVYPENRAT
ncbi:hypothetical protein M427DRAFT_467591 [Gonapodya prolifera JEL478]|uniref:Uncharacterized protein n=1 Tax=Gonapodya prolifera (strain JEL478) TaxID=1344416 RepID=A0A139A1G6_GONPJ|nr:hypothetical protein M427DRAFT_467591 [Gonapodya prolifera JEL478]|eukprot:KXS10627.1 hypothetical protein M427DRAFT_467591 [Gonapodya prolifera JEL478]